VPSCKLRPIVPQVNIIDRTATPPFSGGQQPLRHTIVTHYTMRRATAGARDGSKFNLWDRPPLQLLAGVHRRRRRRRNSSDARKRDLTGTAVAVSGGMEWHYCEPQTEAKWFGVNFLGRHRRSASVPLNLWGWPHY